MPYATRCKGPTAKGENLRFTREDGWRMLRMTAAVLPKPGSVSALDAVVGGRLRRAGTIDERFECDRFEISN